MNDLEPILEVRGPGGEHFVHRLTGEQVSIGRLAQLNTIALEPDPQRLVGRQAHCRVERDGAAWWVVDSGSVNGTLVQQGGTTYAVERRRRLNDGDTIRILGRLSGDGVPAYWDLTFRDPLKTQQAGAIVRPICLEYDYPQARLYRVEAGDRTELYGLRPLEQRLVRYMAQRNAASGDAPVLCTHEELISAVWGDEEPPHTPDDLSSLIWSLRRKLEPNPSEPRLVQTVRGLGYRLQTCHGE
jgi:hypothetical protein